MYNTNLYTFWCVNENKSTRSHENAINFIVFLGPIQNFLKINYEEKRQQSRLVCAVPVLCTWNSRTIWVYTCMYRWMGYGFFTLFI